MDLSFGTIRNIKHNNVHSIYTVTMDINIAADDDESDTYGFVQLEEREKND